MTEAERLRTFVADLLTDVGAEVRVEKDFLWVRVPEGVQPSLEAPGDLCLTFDPERTGEFDAELVAPGSYFLEKVLTLAIRRGRWNVGRVEAPPPGWAERVLAEDPALSRAGFETVSLERREGSLCLFAFRTALTSDEKREAFHVIAVPEDGSDAWEIPLPFPERSVVPASLPESTRNLESAYRRATRTLEDLTRKDVDAFRRVALSSLEEEVRRIFRYFDGTVKEIREADPAGADEIVEAIEAERARRLAEALERFDPHAAATLCSVRVIRTPTVHAIVRIASGESFGIDVDAFTETARGLPAGLTAAGSVPPRGRSPSDTPRRRSSDGSGAAQSPRGSTARSRSDPGRHRTPRVASGHGTSG